MKVPFSIQAKAAFLIAVFSINTLVGFACTVGVNMGFNEGHHDQQEPVVAVVHIHKDGKKHVHQEKKVRHGHGTPQKSNHPSKLEKPDEEKGNCCTDEVRNFEQLDKSVPSLVSVIHPVFFLAFVASYYDQTIFPLTDVVKDIKAFVRSYHPPISDIRIAIQSFQI